MNLNGIEKTKMGKIAQYVWRTNGVLRLCMARVNLVILATPLYFYRNSNNSLAKFIWSNQPAENLTSNGEYY